MIKFRTYASVTHMRPLLTGLAVFISLMIITQYLAYQRYVIASKAEVERAEQEAEIIQDNLHSSLSYSLAATKTLAFIIDQYGVPENFDSIASAILQSSKHIDALELTNEGAITHVFPLEENKSALGFDVLKDPIVGPEARKAIEKRTLFFAGPLTLKQGGTAVVGRLPMYSGDKFIGFSVVLIKLETLLKGAGIDPTNSRFQYQLTKVNAFTGKVESFLPETFPLGDAHAATIDVPDGEWTLYVKQKESSDIFLQAFPFSLLGIFFSVVAGLFIWHLSRQPRHLNNLVQLRTRQVHSLNRLYHLTSRVNQLMVKLKNEKAVLQEVCNIAVDSGEFVFAWIGEIDTSGQLVVPVAFSGAGTKYLDAIMPLDLNGNAKDGPIAKVLWLNNHVYCNDIKNDPLFAPWSSEATAHGFRSCILLPLRKKGKIVATLNLYSGHENLFDDEEIGLLKDVTDDISFALDNIEREKLYREVVEQTEAEKFLSDSIINSMPGIFYLYDRNLKFRRWNNNMESVSGYTAAEMQTITALDLFSPEDRQLISERIETVFRAGSADAVAHLQTRHGQKVPYYFNGRRVILSGTEYAIGMGIDITERVNAENKLLEHTEEIRKLTSYLQQVREEERKKISREIHDELGQQLTGLKMDSSWLRKHFEHDAKASDRITEMITLIDETIKTVRRISSQLRPGILDDLGLIAALDWQGSEFEKRTGIKTTFTSNLSEIEVNEKLATNIFRIYQEALTNVARHAKASRVQSNLNINDKMIALTVSDNGDGIDQKKSGGDSLGIIGMKERARLFDGDLTIEPEIPKGTLIKLTIPVSKQTFADHEVPDFR